MKHTEIHTQIGHCKRGGMPGIIVTINQQALFSKYLDDVAFDMHIPLPDVKNEVQKTRINSCKEHVEAKYWENEKGNHGWCCGFCGTVIQWG